MLTITLRWENGKNEKGGSVRTEKQLVPYTDKYTIRIKI